MNFCSPASTYIYCSVSFFSHGFIGMIFDPWLPYNNVEHFRTWLGKESLSHSHEHTQTQKQVQMQQLPAFIPLAQRGGVSRRLTNYPPTPPPPGGKDSASSLVAALADLVTCLQSALFLGCSPPDHCWPYCTDPVANPVSARVGDSQAESRPPPPMLV